MTRYADDFVIQCESEEEANKVLEHIKEWTAKRGLELHPEKTRITDASKAGGGFDFLGYHFSKHKGKWKKWPRKKSEQKMKTAIREATPRTAGESLEAIIQKINPKLRGCVKGLTAHTQQAGLNTSNTASKQRRKTWTATRGRD